jgi:K+-sensing histidine kinase KdpD
VVGEAPRSRSRQLLQGSFVNRLIRKAADVDLHVVIARAAR